MADGKTHEMYLRTGWYLIIPIGLIWYALSDWNYFYPLFLYMNFGLCDIYVDPDLDHASITKSEHDIKRITKNISPALLVPKKVFRGRRWGMIRGFLSHINLGLLGAFMVAWSQIYEYFASLFGGHRGISHWIVVGTSTRIIWFNAPPYLFVSYMINYSIVNWGTPSWGIVGYNYYWMNIWLAPYVATQAVAWFIGDGYHLALDTELAKGRLYDFEKHGDKRNLLLKRIINKDWVHPPTKKRRR